MPLGYAYADNKNNSIKTTDIPDIYDGLMLAMLQKWHVTILPNAYSLGIE
jgi:hypothetical protein